MPSSIIDTFTDSDRVQKGTILSGLVRIQGNKAAIDDVVKSVRKRIDEGKELYETEDLLKLELIEEFLTPSPTWEVVGFGSPFAVVVAV